MVTGSHDDLINELTERAARRFGDGRAAELADDVARVAAEIAAIQQYPIAIDDEP